MTPNFVSNAIFRSMEITLHACADHLIFFFLVDEGIDDSNTAINGHHWRARRADDGPTLNAGLIAY